METYKFKKGKRNKAMRLSTGSLKLHNVTHSSVGGTNLVRSGCLRRDMRARIKNLDIGDEKQDDDSKGKYNEIEKTVIPDGQNNENMVKTKMTLRSMRKRSMSITRQIMILNTILEQVIEQNKDNDKLMGNVYELCRDSVKYYGLEENDRYDKYDDNNRDLLLDKSSVIYKNNIRKFDRYFVLDKSLGKGAFGDVLLGYDKIEDKYVCIKKSKLDKKGKKHMGNEIRTLKLLKNKHNVIELYDDRVFYDSKCGHIVLEYIEGQNLWSFYQEQNGRIPEDKIVHILRELAIAAGNCHSSNVCHMDIKPSNVMVDNKGNLKLIDFGLSMMMKDNVLKGRSGTRGFSAPEVLIEGNKKEYNGELADVYSIGMTIYVTLEGRSTQNEDYKGKINSYMNDTPYYLNFSRDDVSETLKDFILTMTDIDSNNRPTIKDVINFCENFYL